MQKLTKKASLQILLQFLLTFATLPSTIALDFPQEHILHIALFAASHHFFYFLGILHTPSCPSGNIVAILGRLLTQIRGLVTTANALSKWYAML